jgi:hypothetical protein
VVFVETEILIFIGAWFAYRDRFLTVKQMLAKGVPQGMPYVWQFGIWGDIILISPLLGLIVAWYGGQWSPVEVSVACGIGFLVSAGMHYQYINHPIQIPTSLVYGQRLTLAGWEHFVYMAEALAVLILFYFATSRLSPWLVIITSSVLMVHTAVLGMNTMLKVKPLTWYPSGPLFDRPGIMVSAATGIFLAGLSFYALW